MRNNCLTAPPDSLIGPAEVHPTSEVIIETVETVIRQSVLQELEKQKIRLTMKQI